MKKWLIGSLVGAIIVFLCQFLSWTVLQFHLNETKYTAQQDAVLSSLATNLKDEGVYLLPTVPPGTSMEAAQESGKQWDGKPMALITYVTSFKHSMTMPMIRGFLIDLFLVISAIYLFTRGGTASGASIFVASLVLGLFTWLWGPYTAHNWFQVPMEAIKPQLLDDLVAWGLVGIWLGWWLNRK